MHKNWVEEYGTTVKYKAYFWRTSIHCCCYRILTRMYLGDNVAYYGPESAQSGFLEYPSVPPTGALKIFLV